MEINLKSHYLDKNIYRDIFRQLKKWFYLIKYELILPCASWSYIYLHPKTVSVISESTIMKHMYSSSCNPYSWFWFKILGSDCTWCWAIFALNIFIQSRRHYLIRVIAYLNNFSSSFYASIISIEINIIYLPFVHNHN